MIVNKRAFVVKIDGKDVKLAAIRPSVNVGNQATLIHSAAFRQAIEGGAFVRARLATVLRQQNLWDDAKQAEFELHTKTLIDGEKKLKKGGIKLVEAKQIAIDMRIARYTLDVLREDHNRLDSHTADYFADNEKFNFLISQCIVHEDTGEKYYASYEEYRNRQEDPVALPASDALGAVIYGLKENFESGLPENKFLLKNKFCNEGLHLVDKKGNLIDVLGRRVNENGDLINEDNKLIDEDGELLPEGVDDAVVFLDDDGKPIIEEAPPPAPPNDATPKNTELTTLSV